MLVHASATLHWLQNWTMNWKIASGTEKYAKEKKGTWEFVCGPMFYSRRSQIVGEKWRLVLFTNLCQYVKLRKSMSTRWLLFWQLKWLWQEFRLGEGLTQARCTNLLEQVQFSAVLDIMHLSHRVDLPLKLECGSFVSPLWQWEQCMNYTNTVDLSLWRIVAVWLGAMVPVWQRFYM